MEAQGGSNVSTNSKGTLNFGSGMSQVLVTRVLNGESEVGLDVLSRSTYHHCARETRAE
jgi:hypothetical protein